MHGQNNLMTDHSDHSPMHPPHQTDRSQLNRTPTSSINHQRYWSEGSLNTIHSSVSDSFRGDLVSTEDSLRRKRSSDILSYGEPSSTPANKRQALDSRTHPSSDLDIRYQSGPFTSSIASTSRSSYDRIERMEEGEIREGGHLHTHPDRREQMARFRDSSPPLSQNSLSSDSAKRLSDTTRDARFVDDRASPRPAQLESQHLTATSSRTQFPLLSGPFYDSDYIYMMMNYGGDGYLRNINYALPLLSRHMTRNSGVKPVFQAMRATLTSNKETHWRAQVIADKRRGIRGIGDGKSKKTAIINAALSACLQLDSHGLLHRWEAKNAKPVISNDQQTILVVDHFLEEDDVISLAEQSSSQSSRAESLTLGTEVKPLLSKSSVTPLSSASGTHQSIRPLSDSLHREISRPSLTPSQERSSPPPTSPRLSRVEPTNHIHLVDVIERELRRLQTENTQHKDSLQRVEARLRRRESELEDLRRDQFEQHAKQMLDEEERINREQKLLRSLNDALAKNRQYEEQALGAKAELSHVQLQSDALEKDLKNQILETERLRAERDVLLAKIEKISTEPDPAVTSLKEAFKRMEEVVESVLSVGR